MVVLSKIKVKENDENGVGASRGRSTEDFDHWAFLDEIEAPMWVDLSVESKLMNEDNDDAWFHKSHPFHYHSAQHLRYTFAHPEAGSHPFNFILRRQCSPHLPSSVSKSRGKDYRSIEWRRNHHQVSLDKGHPINELGGRISSYHTNVLSQQCEPQVSLENKSEVYSSITSVDDSERRVALNFQSSSTSGLSSSTITSGNLQHDSKVLGMPKDAFGHTVNLLNSLRNNLRKSRASKPALRVEISDDREFNGHKSSDGKSSVGSSSTIGYDKKGKELRCCKSSTGKSSEGSYGTGNDTKGMGFAVVLKANHCEHAKAEKNGSMRPKDLKTSSWKANVGISIPKFESKKIAAHLKVDNGKRLDLRDFGKLAKPINGRVKVKKLIEAPVSARNFHCSKIGSKDTDAPSGGQKVLKSKVLLEKMHNDSLNRPRFTQGVRGKVGRNQSSEKANFRGRAVLSHKVAGKENVPAAAASDHKALKLKSKDKVGVTSIGSKVRIGTMTDGIVSPDTRFYLR